MVWDEQTIALLKDLWTQGLSTADIGRRLGVTKNAVVGKAHRLELDARPSPIRRDAVKIITERPAALSRTAGPTLPPLASDGMAVITPSQPNVRHLRPAPLPEPPKAAAVPATPSALPRRITVPTPQPRRAAPSCCWPIGEPGTKTFRFCEEASVAGKPYCDEHAKLAYVKIRDRKEDAA